MIDIRKLKELVRLMVENDLTELDLQDQEETVTIKRGPSGEPLVHRSVPNAGAAAAEPESQAAGEGQPAGPDNGLVPVTSPMVGTFYAAPNPDAEPFASTGANVGPDSVVCMIEAMKVFNEIKAEIAGTVERVLVNNGDAVEFGQKLFLIRPA